MWANVEHSGNVVELRGSSIPLSTDFAERVYHSSLTQWAQHLHASNDNQEQEMRTVANENEITINGSTENKVSTIKGNGKPTILIPPSTVDYILA